MSNLRRPLIGSALALALATAGLVAAQSPAVATGVVGSTGTQQVLVMRAYWTGTEPATPSEADTQTLVSDVQDWFTENAGDHLSLTVDHTAWLPISGPNPSLTCQADAASLLQQAEDATPSDFTLASYEDFVLYFPQCADSSDATWASLGAQGVWLNGVFDLHSVVNGLGHNMGLPTADARECVQGDQQPTCDVIAGGDFGGMGATFTSHFSALEKHRLGWFDTSQVSDLTAGGSTTLGALSIAGAHVAFFTVGARTYWLEYRYPIGYDAVLPTEATDGVLVHEIDSSGVPLLDNTRPMSEAPDDWTIQVGQAWVTREGYTISVTAGTTGSAHVNVSPPPRLTVTKQGAGSGTVTSSPAGISCGTTCSVPYKGGTQVTLTAAPASGSTFGGWSGGGCAGTSTCTVTLSSDTTVAATFSSLRAEESAVGLDGWSVVPNATANGGTWRQSATKGNTASFAFTGTAVTLVTHKGPQLGIAAVKIDGVSTGTVDLFASSDQAFSKAFGGLAAKKHTVVITVNGTKNASSTGTGVVVDAFTVGATTTQDSAKTVTFDTWKSANATAASGGAYRSTAKANATATLAFTGTSIDWITATGPNRGKAGVAIDGVGKGTVDLYATSAHWQVAQTYGGLSAGAHTIRVTVLGTKNAASSSAAVPVDAFVAH